MATKPKFSLKMMMEIAQNNQTTPVARKKSLKKRIVFGVIVILKSGVNTGVNVMFFCFKPIGQLRNQKVNELPALFDPRFLLHTARKQGNMFAEYLNI